jgi:3-oxoadipate enol-lactonase
MRVNGVEVYYEEQGSGSETIVFAHGLGMSSRMFDNQVAALRGRYRCIAFDFRGQGQSETTRTGYEMETATEDSAALIGALNCAPCHFVGLSMGGVVGMLLAVHHPEFIKSLTLIGATADPEAGSKKALYLLLSLIARLFGAGATAKQGMQVLFGKKFLTDPAREAERQEWLQRMSSSSGVGFARAMLGVINRKDIASEIGKITAPTLILVGDQDGVAGPDKSQRIRERIVGSKLVLIPGAGHSSTIEEPAAVTAEITAFLNNMATCGYSSSEAKRPLNNWW